MGLPAKPIFLDNFNYITAGTQPTIPSQIYIDALGPGRPHRADQPPGGYWTFGSSQAVVTANNTLRAAGWEGGATASYPTSQPGSSDYMIAMVAKHYSVVANSGWRLVIGNVTNGYQLQSYNGSWEIDRVDAGTATRVGSAYTEAFVDARTYLFYNLDHVKSFWSNGVERILVADTKYGNNRSVGFSPFAVTGGVTDTAGSHLKQFAIYQFQRVKLATDPNVLRSLSGLFDDDQTVRISRAGPLFEFNVSGTTHVILKFNTVAMGAPWNATASVRIYVDNVEAKTQVLSSGVDAMIVNNLTTAAHTIKVEVYQIANYRYTDQIKITGCLVDEGATVLSPPTYLGHVALFGDSIFDAVAAAAGNTMDFAMGYIAKTYTQLGLRISNRSAAGWGAGQPIQDIPDFVASWNKAAEDRALDSYATITHIETNIGQNVGTGWTSGLVQSYLASQRAKAVADGVPTAIHFFSVPLSGNQASTMLTGFNAYQAATPDPYTIFIPTTALKTQYASQTPTYSNDGVHPNTLGNNQLTPITVAERTPYVIGPTAPTLTATPDELRVALSWTAPSGAVNYVLYRNGTPIYTGTGTSYLDSLLPPGTAVSYQVRGINANSIAGTLSAVVTATPTYAPPLRSQRDITVVPGQLIASTFESYRAGRDLSDGTWTVSVLRHSTGTSTLATLGTATTTTLAYTYSTSGWAAGETGTVRLIKGGVVYATHAIQIQQVIPSLGGVGAIAVTVQTGVANAVVRAIGPSNEIIITDSSGAGVLGLSTGSYTFLASKSGYTTAVVTQTISTDTTIPFTLNPTAVPSAPSDQEVSGYLYTFDKDNVADPGAVVQFMLFSTKLTGLGLSREIRSATSDGSALLTINLWKNSTYKARRVYDDGSTGEWYEVVTGTTSPFALPAVLGKVL